MKPKHVPFNVPKVVINEFKENKSKLEETPKFKKSIEGGLGDKVMDFNLHD